MVERTENRFKLKFPLLDSDFWAFSHLLSIVTCSTVSRQRGSWRLAPALVLLCLMPFTARAATPAQVDTAMKKAVGCIYAQEANGNWETVATPTTDAGAVTGLQWTGMTAISTYALLCAGESETDPRLVSAINFLSEHPSGGVYAAASRCLVWSRIKLTPAMHVAAQKDVDFLLKAVHSAGEGRGLFFYTLPSGPNDPAYDHSTSQMGALGLSVMAPRGFEIPQEFWRLTEQAWQHHQLPDGSWVYGPGYTRGVASMTAAGIATAFITQTMLHDSTDCKGNAGDPTIEKALKWLADNFDATFDPARETAGLHLEQYALFAISRVGVASGLRYFGKVDWYQRGTDYLVTTQQADGNWISSRPASAQLGLLFLAYGSSPAVVSKLEYALSPEHGKPAVARWNQRPQDLLNFTDWMGHQLEHRFNWQVVNLVSTPEALHGAPVMVIAGSEALNFSDDDVAKLRQFVEDGGMIVGNADCGSAAFSKSFAKLGSLMFPGYEFRELPPTHPIYTNEQYGASKFRQPPHLEGLSNGVRELMLLPSADLSRAFQHHNEALAPDFYHLFDNIILYAMDTSGLEHKGNTYLVNEDPAVPVARTIKLARLRYSGNWDPEPGGWRRLAAVLHNTQKIEMKVEAVKLGDGSLITPSVPTKSAMRPTEKEIRQMAMKRIPPADLSSAMLEGPEKAEALIKAKVAEINKELDAADAARAAGNANFKIAHLTGTEALKLTDPQREELKKFVEAGGTLVIDAAGGSTEFAASAEQMLRDTFGSDSAALNEPLPPDAPIYRLKEHALEEVRYRNFARSRMSSTKSPQLRGIRINGRLAVIYSREDLSAGLVGEPMDGITGYTPATATELMTDVILQAGASGTLSPSTPPH